MGKADPLLGEGGPGKARDGCGAGRRTDLVPPLFRRCGGTFPQGKVREPEAAFPHGEGGPGAARAG